MRFSDYPDDIQRAAEDATDRIEGDGVPGGGYSWASIEEAIAFAIKQELERCAAWATSASGSKTIREAIAEGNAA